MKIDASTNKESNIKWSKEVPKTPGWYWTRCASWPLTTLLPGEVKSNGDTYSLWGDHDIEWHSDMIKKPD